MLNGRERDRKSNRRTTTQISSEEVSSHVLNMCCDKQPNISMFLLVTPHHSTLSYHVQSPLSSAGQSIAQCRAAYTGLCEEMAIRGSKNELMMQMHSLRDKIKSRYIHTVVFSAIVNHTCITTLATFFLKQHLRTQ